MTSPKAPVRAAAAVAAQSAARGAPPPALSRAQHDRMANAIRALAMDSLDIAKY
jgi:hypothetical protein